MLVKGVLIIRTRRSILMVVAVFLLASLPLGVTSADSLPPSVSISVTPEQEYYDAFENETFQQSIEFRINWLNLQEGTNYTVQLYIMKEYQTYGEDGMKSSANIFPYPINPVKNLDDFAETGTLGAIENNTNYTYFAKLRTEEQGQGDSFIYLAQYNFTIGQEPVAEPQPLQNLALNCDLGDDNIWDMYTEDYGTIPYKTTILGEIECNLTNSNSVTAFYNLSDFAYLGDGALQEGADFDIPSWLHNSNSIPAFSTGESFNISLDCGEPSHCEETNGTLGFVIQTYSEDETNWSESEIQHYIDYSIENNSIIPPVIIRGCMNETAENFNANATEDDGSCVYPQPLFASISATPTLGYGPLLVSLEVTITGGNTPYEVEWNLGDGTTSNQLEFEHVFSPGGYSVNVTVTDRNNRTVSDVIPIMVHEPTPPTPLSGHIGHSGQLEPMTEGMVATVEFIASATGGSGQYTYQWRFGDTGHTTAAQLEQLDSQYSEDVAVHEYAAAGTYTITLTITDSNGEKFEANTSIEIVDHRKENEGSGIEEKPPKTGGVQEMDLFIASTSGLCLLMLFGLTGRRLRKEKYLEKLRNEQMGGWGPTDEALWDEVDF